MKLAPSGVGAEPKKLALLVAILVAGGLVYWFQNRSGAPEQTVSANVTPAAVPAVKQLPAAKVPVRAADPTPPAPLRRAPGGGIGTSTMEDFRPSLKVKDDVDLTKVDPRIRLDLLAKVRAVPMEGGSSSLFEFGKPPEPPTPKVDPIKPAAVPVPLPPKATTQTKPPPPPVPPPPPPIPFKFYGYAGKAADGQLQGFFREGDPNTGDIFLRREGDVIKDRYKIVRIGIRSAIVEDTVSHNQQTLPLLEEQQ
jgi:hypothetical protein